MADNVLLLELFPGILLAQLGEVTIPGIVELDLYIA